jgi:hypothetical protein
LEIAGDFHIPTARRLLLSLSQFKTQEHAPSAHAITSSLEAEEEGQIEKATYHFQAHHISSERDFGEVGIVGGDAAGDGVRALDVAFLGQLSEREKTAFACADDKCSTLSFFDDKALEQADRTDGSNQFVKVFFGTAGANVAVPERELVERDLDGFEFSEVEH